MKRHLFVLMAVPYLTVMVALLIGLSCFDPSIYLFRIHDGMTPDQVVAMVGKPTGIKNESWAYTHGTVSFRHDQVVKVWATL